MNAGVSRWEAVSDGTGRYAGRALQVVPLGGLLRLRCVWRTSRWGVVERWYVPPPMPLSARALAAPLFVVLALVLSACGGSGGDPSADPAAVVPPGTAVYIEARFKLDDDQKELAKKLSGEEDPGAAFKRWFEKEAAEENPGFKFSEDVDPWLGERGAIFVPKVAVGGDSTVGAIMSTKDADEAEKALERTLREGDAGGEKPRVTTRKHRDVEYFVDTSDDDAAGVIEDYAVVGNDAALKAVIDQAAGDADPLADTSEYKKARDSVGGDGAAFVYVRLSQLFSALGPQGAAARQAFGGLGETFAVGLDGDESKIELDSAALGAEGAAAGAGPGEVLPTLPSSAWLAAGVADLGERLQETIDQFTQLGALGGQDPEKLLDQIEAQLGIDPRRDVAAWMGDVGLFVFGDKPQEAGGGLVAQAKDADAARRALPRLARFAATFAGARVRELSRGGVDTGVTLTSPQLPIPIHMALTDDDRFILAVTDGALAQTLRETDPLGESQPFKDAGASLGEGFQQQMFMNFAPIAELLEASGSASDPEAAKLQEALAKLSTAAAGAKREGDVARGRLVVGVK